MPITVDQLKNPLADSDRKQLEKAIQLAGRGDHDGAIGQLSRVLARRPKTRPYVTSIRGAEYLEVHRWNEAEADLQQAVELMPQTPMNYYNYALALIRNGKHAQAEKAARRSWELDHGRQAAQILIILANQKESGRK